MMRRFSIRTTRRIEFVDITDQVRAALKASGVPAGVCVVFCPHTTAGLTINENADPAVVKDMSAALSGLVPADAGYAHAEGNSDSHIKSSLFGPTLSVIVEDGDLRLGAWQGIYFCESDGPRQRECWVKIVRG
ncbi:MAG TPA: secondary thiamine-phosphate synthase enzyme YjbQ [Candidatus Omnitrophota bacterium]|nr:secondary thiamine-phosphate synthase enzyme YjbQ [Candidatus Omnitrophota bacterium]